MRIVFKYNSFKKLSGLAEKPRHKYFIMRFRKALLLKFIAAFVCLNFLFQVFYPTAALALTGGPSQPEMQAFSPVGSTDMVDLATGSYDYNIPLLDVEGYPINLS